MKTMYILFSIVFLSLTTLAGNPGVSYQGRIIKPDGSPLEGANVQFRMQVRSPGSENCLLYEEIQSINMLGSSGVFSVTLNDGSGTRVDSPTYQIDRLFANRDTMTLDSTRCSVGTTYSPNSGDGRKFIVYFKDETMSAYEPLPILSLNYTPQSMYALEAQKVDKFSASHLLRAVDGSGNPATAPAFDPAQLTSLTNLLAGTSTQYATTTQFNTVQGFAKTILPTCLTGEVLKANGSTLSCVTDTTGAGGGTVSNVTSTNNYLSVATGTTTPALTLNVGTTINTVAAGNDSRITGALQSGTAAGGSLSGTYPNPGIAAGAVTNNEISGSAAIVDTKLATISTPGKVSGSAITSGTITGSTVINTSGNIQTSGSLALYDAGPTNAVSVKAPTSVTTSYNLILPTEKPASNGLLLSGDTAGNLTWVTPSAGSVTNVTATAPIVSSGGVTPNISLAQANTTTNGFLSSGDWNTFNSKLSGTLTSGNIFVGNGSNAATSVAPSGDVSLTNLGAFTVSRIRGTTVSATTPTTSGQILRFDGSQWAPNYISMFDLRSTITGATTFSSGCTAAQTLTWTAATDNLSCTSIAIAGSQVSGNITGNAANVTGVVDAANGGTGQSSYTVGDLLYASTTSALSRLPASTSGYVLTTNGAGTAPSWQAAGGSSQWTTSGANVYYNSGNVGIGTASPSTPLTVASGTSAMKVSPGWSSGIGTWIDLDTNGPSGIGTGGPGVNAWIAYTANVNQWFNGTAAGDVNYRNVFGKKINIGIDNGGGTASPTMTFSGSNLGIGTTNPNTLLTVKPSTETNAITIKNTGDVDTVVIGVGTGGHGKFILNNTSGGQAVAVLGNSSAGAYLGVSAGISTLADGATTSFGAGLNISVPNVLNNENGISFGTSDISTRPAAAVTFYDSDTSTYGNGGLRFKTSSGTLTTRMTIDPTGNVGIGAASPQTKLQVAGVISPATNNTHSLGNATYRFTEVYATNGVINTSDRREKKDINDTNLGLDFINLLRPVSYRWNTGVDEDIHYGLIAQEAEQAVLQTRQDNQKTSIVTHDQATDKYGVRYSELISPIIKAVQELYSKLLGVERNIASVKVDIENERISKDQEIERLKKENADIKARLEKIEKMLNSK